MSPILFIHIPKTAGTSLNASAANIFGDKAIERDYGPDVEHTSDNIKTYVYGTDTVDQFGFREACRDAETRWVTGHFPADRFLHLFGAQHTISFVRDPVERVISEYLYRKQIGTTELDFKSFYRHAPEQNKQHHMIGHFPWKAFHLVGTQEAYAESVALLSQNLNLNFEVLSRNVQSRAELNRFDEQTRKEIHAVNAKDTALVDSVRLYLKKQFEVASKHQAFCYHDIAFEPDVHFIGWAFFADNEFPVNIQLWVDGNHRDTIKASEHRPELQAIGTPRMGHNGFRFVLAPYKNCSTLELRTEETGQYLFQWQRP